jgi:hypothetical protein
VGLALLSDDRAAPHLASGTLVRVLEEWCPPFRVSSATARVAGSSPPRCRPSSSACLSEVNSVAASTHRHPLVRARLSRNP